MRRSKMPERIKHYIARRPELFKSAHMELDEFGGSESPYSVWAYLQPGYCVASGEHQIHEYTVEDFIGMAHSITVCECAECKQLMGQNT